MGDIYVLKRLILHKLIRADMWGGKHTPLDFIVRGIPEHYRNTHKGKKAIEKVFKNLLNDGWILVLSKKTGKGSGDRVSLNSRKVNEIKQFLEVAHF